MFGYVIINKPELKIREFQTYQSYYCGLCRALKEKFGARGQISLSYDMTFLALLLSKLYEPEEDVSNHRCVVHPMQKQQVRKNEMIDYVADMNLLLTWYKCADDAKDEKKVWKAVYGKTISKETQRIRDCYPRQQQAVCKCLEQLLLLEQNDERDIDALSACFGHLLEEIFVVKQDEWEQYLRKIGFYIGKFVYIIDAYDDLQTDRKKGLFNPFIEKEKERDLDDWVKQLLIMIAAEFAREFEKLPIVEDIEILRNIIYSGIWIRYEEIKKRRNENMEENDEKSI